MGFLRQMFSGGITPNDPRRFVVEAMLGAMAADGDVQDEEMEVLQRNLDEHQLFHGLTGDAASRLLDIASESVQSADGDNHRIAAAIARGLPSRSHRLAAYAMACQVCVSDRQMNEGEIDYLEALQGALALGDDEAREIFEAARAQSGLLTLEEKTARMRELLPQFVKCMSLMAIADGELHEDELESVRAVLQHIPDMAVLPPAELERFVQQTFMDLRDSDAVDELVACAQAITDPADRYWTTVYMMIIALADGHQDWREVVFLNRAQDVLGLTEEQMDAAMETAELFPSVELGGNAPE